MTDRALAVVRAGALTTVQDEGRPGHAHLGVPRSGALDLPA
ncbi:allophanate hydrolase subunit 2 family protein, partial [Streptomyces sp. T-3]|nr:allophanate hydrolase subunit 2 family protein [Streptomyces sp. T-3]